MEGPVAATPPKAAPAQQQYPHTPEDLRKEASYPIWLRLRSGDRTARDELAIKYAPLVKYVIGRMAISLPAAMDSDDVLSAGTVGLLHAIDRFDPDQGVRFETYALQRIRGAIIDSVRSLSPLSRGAGRRARLLDETTAGLAQRLGRAPTQDELARELGIDQAELGRMLLESAHVIVSLDGSGGGDEDGDVQSLRDLLHDPDEAGTDELVEENELVERLGVAIAALPPRDRLVLNLYYHEELTLKEISRVIDVSESRVSQIHTAAVMKLRGLLRANQQPARLAA
ncbi:MAG: FliA/WhiG family RNA polymerase sigma factor [Chloroflexota bacterium]|nr:FliA/WhiG family RNA polymerase sigma factor [Chloroflexota bacterium]